MITVIKPGLLTSVQDLGRFGFQKYGVIVSGVMDPLAHRISNLLVGNEENEPTLELTLLGPMIEFKENALISICGGDLSPSVNGKPVRLWRSVFVKKGSLLQFGPCKIGCRAYLAVAGGFNVPTIMNSSSTYLRAEIGGFNGRALKAGDQLKFGSPSNLSTRIIKHLVKGLGNQQFVEMEWSVATDLIPIHRNNPAIRVMRGKQFHLFTKESQFNFFHKPFEVTTQSDRMGYRLKGPKLKLENAEEMISEAVNFGTIQVPSDGDPIVLLADRQTTGGYPKIAQIASVDLPLMAQAKPGDSINFTEISHDEAQHLLLERERKIQQFKQGIILKFR
ncbi:biotin-dependent carboxyltransferase family protein [Bacillus methanolicus]|uniref:KipI antagonist n=1 Tax=Bacillus methanolicus (strain MGA3 / ATCC 53907) TaxID=796606 RepID=I3E335_BACMM|nr:biotin-dependent carboxyltransferase family protein [Bacillus methanolicus]AIE58997.1 KipI antagonist [Bacillus methanolicus MGA3]EIJ80906.1 allophanate hydrolase subunit 2 [Bacillus methanolicus MGA3]UQD51087.1 allophanate hydrolase subunit 2 family protein [Bacillus methanolicus]